MKRQRPIFPCSCPHSIIGAEELNFRVRDGNGWTLFAFVTGSPAQTGDPSSSESASAFRGFSLIRYSLNFAERAAPPADRCRPSHQTFPQILAFSPDASTSRSLETSRSIIRAAPLTCYQASTCRLSTRSSSWDLHRISMGALILGPASRLDAFSAYPFWA